MRCGPGHAPLSKGIPRLLSTSSVHVRLQLPTPRANKLNPSVHLSQPTSSNGPRSPPARRPQSLSDTHLVLLSETLDTQLYCTGDGRTTPAKSVRSVPPLRGSRFPFRPNLSLGHQRAFSFRISASLRSQPTGNDHRIDWKGQQTAVYPVQQYVRRSRPGRNRLKPAGSSFVINSFGKQRHTERED